MPAEVGIAATLRLTVPAPLVLIGIGCNPFARWPVITILSDGAAASPSSARRPRRDAKSSFVDIVQFPSTCDSTDLGGLTHFGDCFYAEQVQR